MVEASLITSIPISKITRESLRGALRDGETWDSGITRLLREGLSASKDTEARLNRALEELKGARDSEKAALWEGDHAKRELDIASRLIRERNAEIKRLRAGVAELTAAPPVSEPSPLPGGFALVVWVLFKWQEERRTMGESLRRLREENARLRAGVVSLAGSSEPPIPAIPENLAEGLERAGL